MIARQCGAMGATFSFVVKGGREAAFKVLDALEDCFGLQRGDLSIAREVLRAHGNMSAVTVLFVLRAALDAGARGPQLLTTLGPGFTAGMMVVEPV